MNRIFVLFVVFFVELFAETIVFVHIGTEMPKHLDWALMQARLFNDCEIVLIANKKPLEGYQECLEKHNVSAIACEDLKRSPQHEKFARYSQLDRKFRGGFWFFASERFFYLDEFMQQYGVDNVIHLESDVMLYCSLSELLEVFLENYPGLGVTFDTDERCIPGFVFVRTKEVISQLTKFMANLQGQDDMYAIGEFRKKVGSEMVKTLPIVHGEYVESCKIESLRRSDYSNLVGEFQSLFDAAYHGHYLGGEDPRNGPQGPGFVNPHCVINASFLQYSWERDDKNRLVPFANFGGNKLRINNLHIHCKRLWDFYSKQQ